MPQTQPPPFAPPQSQAPGYQPGPPSPMYQPPLASAGLQPNLAGALCYLCGFITGIIFLALDPHNRDRFVRFHAFQSIFFSVGWIALFIALSMFEVMLPWPFHVVITLLIVMARFGLFLTWLYLMYKAYNNETFKLPVIGDLAEKQVG